MAQQLIRSAYTYRVDTEDEALGLIEDFKNRQLAENFTLSKSSYTLKTKKQKGEIVDQWFLTSVTIDMN